MIVITYVLRSILIVSSHILLGLLSGHFPVGFPITILYAFLVSPMPSPLHITVFHFE
jgi:hypothetical protein